MLNSWVEPTSAKNKAGAMMAFEEDPLDGTFWSSEVTAIAAVK